MMALVQLRLGDIFDGPSDLIVLPFSTSGKTSLFVHQRLIHYRIPFPQPGMKLGDVVILPFRGGENIAQFIAYAASVDGNSSSTEAIRRIGQKLGASTTKRSTIRLVSVPLLGAGAGKLQSESVVDALTQGFKEKAQQDARLVIHVLRQDLYDRLSRRNFQTHGSMTSTPETPLRVFISYNHTSPEHEKWVEQLSTFLRASGVNARLDIWHLRRGMDLPQFMTNELALAHRVILVSDEKYAEKADGRVGGVGWETMIVQGDMAQLLPDSNKYLVVVRSKSLAEGLPRYLRTKFAIHWPNGKANKRIRQTLLRELYGLVKAPPIGERPVYL